MLYIWVCQLYLEQDPETPMQLWEFTALKLTFQNNKEKMDFALYSMCVVHWDYLEELSHISYL